MTDNLSIYQHLQNQLSELIEKSPRGTKLLSEPELAQEFGVSRATLREVMRTFESQGLLRRRQGLGTFVVKPSRVIESGLEVLESIETQAKKIGLEVSMGEMEISYIRADEEQVEKLSCKPGVMLIKLERVILSEGAPAAFLVDILPRGIISRDTLSKKFTGSVLDILIQNGKPSLSISKTEISAINAPEDVAKALDIQRGDTLLLLNGVLFDGDEKPVDLSYSYFLPGHFRLHIIRKIGGVAS
jgi:GntR family transcriptional regulator